MKTIVLLLLLTISPLCHAKEPVAQPFFIDGSDTAIHTWGGGSLLAKVFNAISMLIYGNDKGTISKTFHAILRISLTAGGFCCVCLALFREKFEPLIKCFFLPALAIFCMLLTPRTTVHIQDHLVQKARDSKTPAFITVDNVPFFLGKLASLVSTVSFYFTQALESVSHGTNDAMYNWTGHIYAAENIFQAKKCRIGNRVLEDNFREFCRECVYRDVGIGLYTKDDLIHAKDLLSFLEANTSNLRTVFYRPEGTFLTCKEAMRRMNQLFHGEQGNTREIVLGEMGNDIFFLLGQKEQGEAALQKLMKQQIAIDLLKEEMPGTLNSFASKRAEILQKENQKILGALGASSIVAMRNFFEALIYTVFPLMIVISLLSFGIKPLISWAQFVLWVNTWPPFYVVVKFLLNSIWEFRKRAIWGESVDLTLFTSDGLCELYSSMESIAAVAMAFIPFLSWIILKGGVSQMVHMAASLMSPAQSSASTAASEKTSGNYTFGNISVDSLSGHNAHMFKQSYSGQLTSGSVSLDTGRETSTLASGELYVRQSDSYLREGISRSEAFSSSLQNSLSTSESSVLESSNAFSKGVTQTANQALGFTQALSKSIQSGKTWNLQESTSFQEAYQYLSGVAEEHGTSKGISKDDALREVISAGLSSGGLLKFVGVKGEFQSSMQQGVSRFESDTALDKAMKTETFQKHIQTIKNLSKTEVGSILNAEDARLHEDFSHSLNETDSSMEQWRSALSKQQALSDLKSYSESDNLSLNQKLDQRFVEFLGNKYGGDIGRVTDTLDLPSSHPQKRALIDAFITDYLPKAAVVDPSLIQDAHRNESRSIPEVSKEGFTLKAKDFTPGNPKEEVERLERTVEEESLRHQKNIESQKDRLHYSPAPDYEKKALWEHGATNMWIPKIVNTGKEVLNAGRRAKMQVMQLGATNIHKELFGAIQDKIDETPKK